MYLWPSEILSQFDISLNKPDYGKLTSVINEDCLEIVLENVDKDMFDSIVEYLYNFNEFNYSDEGFVNLEDLIIEDSYTICFNARNSEFDNFVLCDIAYISQQNNNYIYTINSMIFKIERY